MLSNVTFRVVSYDNHDRIFKDSQSPDSNKRLILISNIGLFILQGLWNQKKVIFSEFWGLHFERKMV